MLPRSFSVPAHLHERSREERAATLPAVGRQPPNRLRLQRTQTATASPVTVLSPVTQSFEDPFGIPQFATPKDSKRWSWLRYPPLEEVPAPASTYAERIEPAASSNITYASRSKSFSHLASSTSTPYEAELTRTASLFHSPAQNSGRGSANSKRHPADVHSTLQAEDKLGVLQLERRTLATATLNWIRRDRPPDQPPPLSDNEDEIPDDPDKLCEKHRSRSRKSLQAMEEHGAYKHPRSRSDGPVIFRDSGDELDPFDEEDGVFLRQVKKVVGFM